MTKTLLILFVTVGRLFAQAAMHSVQLEVLSSTVDFNSRNLKIELHNGSLKVATAYVLHIEQLDASGKLVGQAENLGIDALPNDVEGSASPQWKSIQPGANTVVPIGTGVLADAVSAKVSVEGVVYADRTFEGSEKAVAPCFIGRANDAKEARKAAALLTPYPETEEAVQVAVKGLRLMPHGIGLGVIANQIGLSGDVAGVLFDRNRPVSGIGVPSRQQWDEIVAALSKRAAYLESESQEVRQ